MWLMWTVERHKLYTWLNIAQRQKAHNLAISSRWTVTFISGHALSVTPFVSNEKSHNQNTTEKETIFHPIPLQDAVEKKHRGPDWAGSMITGKVRPNEASHWSGWTRGVGGIGCVRRTLCFSQSFCVAINRAAEWLIRAQDKVIRKAPST